MKKYKSAKSIKRTYLCMGINTMACTRESFLKEANILMSRGKEYMCAKSIFSWIEKENMHRATGWFRRACFIYEVWREYACIHLFSQDMYVAKANVFHAH